MTAVLGCQYIKTNSYHRQAIKDISENLHVSARADDGIIESIEFEDKDFAVGVQWNPEFCVSGLDRCLFSAFIKTALNRRLKHS